MSAQDSSGPDQSNETRLRDCTSARHRSQYDKAENAVPEREQPKVFSEIQENAERIRSIDHVTPERHW